ncbi:integrase core domain-containing protein, partial [Phaeovulum sp.]|uniref:integrase core domain-containing protein n=1 Tax=Phaeovulum sp. TaxID=2934796 RepID=UPI0039E67E39
FTIGSIPKSDRRRRRLTLKQEAVYLHELQDGFQAKRVIDEWLEFYNAERPHTALAKRTPDGAYLDPAQINQAA